MIGLMLAAVISLAQQPSTAAVTALAERRDTDAALVSFAREETDTLREAISRSLRRSVHAASPPERQAGLRIAHRLAHAYAVAWRDSFHVRQVTRFERLNRRQRLARLRADSLRIAGNTALVQDGVPAAMRLWRASLATADRARDSAAMAAALGNLGAGFYRKGTLDSAEIYLARSRALATTIGDLRTAANSTGILASVYRDREDHARAADFYTAASALRERSGDGRGLAADQNNLGLLARDLGDLDAARSAFERALMLNRSGGRLHASALNVMNLAGLASLVGEYARADSLYGQALELEIRAGGTAEIPFVLHERGLLRVRRGQYPAAEVDLRAALAGHEESGAVAAAIAVRRDLASVLAATGQPQRALVMLREAVDQARAGHADDALRGDLALAQGDLAAGLNEFEQASEHYAAAERLYRAQGEEFGVSAVAEGRAFLAYMRENYEESLAALEAAQLTYRRAADERAAALTQISMSYAHARLGNVAVARRNALAALGTLGRLDDVVGHAAALLALGEIDMARGLPVAAEKHFRNGLRLVADRPATDVRWRLQTGLAGALRAQRQLAPAIEQLQAAALQIEQSAATLLADERRVGFLADKLDVYAQLALAERARGNVDAAFAASERMRAHQLLLMLSRSRVERTHPLTAREQDLRRQIAELTRNVVENGQSASGSREVTSRAMASAREALYRAQSAYARLLTELREQDPAYAEIVSPAHASTADVVRRLGRDEALVEYLVTDSTVLAFVITNRTTAVVDLNVTRRTLAPLIDFSVRVIQRREEATAGMLWQTPLARLYDYLVAPIVEAGHLRDKNSLVVVPHGELHFVPFAALIDRQKSSFLVDRWNVSYAPSASVWLNLRSRTWDPHGTVVALAPRTDVLPFSGAEVATIQQIYGRRVTALIGNRASKRSLRAALPGSSIVHLATLGILNKHNPLFSFVDLGMQERARELLEVHEVFDLALSGQLVILSACQTGLGSGVLADVPPGDDWTGLVQSFLAAGAGGVVASLWAVNDQATADLMGRFHRGIHAGAGAARALADAQRAAIRSPATAHPFYWAAFTAHGGPLDSRR